ncbi:response regulator transcription factor [Streptomyces cyaneochromogenes]|uniref:response regulator transcription factor n=1 Tax=Streptomyces cyaneochromogenes TaxID=2496836 RepID=UPI002B216AE3|nr:helix-turn-helix transcriptional regulator [Streptomyces cyaneochromogenes]
MRCRACACTPLSAISRTSTAASDAPGLEAGSPPLTSRQHQIVRLVAQGATNKEVAARLYLSPRTVDCHLRRIFERLGITSRADLIRRCAADAGSGR